MKKKKILIIDDDEDYRFMMRKCLERAGYECRCSSSVEEALEAISEVFPDLVILDLGLQHASGYAFLQNMNDHAKFNQRQPSILVVSGYNDKEIIDHVSTLGASRFLAKPVSSRQILSAVNTFIH